MMVRAIENNSRQRVHINNPFENEYVKVHFIGDVIMSRYDEIDYHYNPGYEVCIITNGKGIFKINDKSYPISSGQVFMTKPSQFHGGWPSKENPYRILYICFSVKHEDGQQKQFWEEVDRRLNEARVPVADEMYNMKEIHKRIIREVMEPGDYSVKITDSCLEQIVLLTLRNLSEIRSSENKPLQKCSGKSLSHKIIYYIDENINNSVDLNMISQNFKYSIPYLCRCFKKETGFAIMEYYNYSRLERAKRDIETGEGSISSIAYKYSYGSIHHFSNAFKDVYGMAPTEHRNLCFRKPNEG